MIILHVAVALIFLSFVQGTGNRNDNPHVVNFKANFKKDQIDGRRRHHHKDHRNNGKDALRIRNQYPIKYEPGAFRILGGNSSNNKNFPYMAAVIINGRLWCAGSLVDENWVITAAHCLNYVLHVSPMKSLGQYVKVRIGSSMPHEGGIVLDVVGAVRHPKFEEEPVPHADVALLKLSQNVELGKFANIIKIYDGMKEPYAQSFVVVSGWGATRGSETAFRDPTPDLLNGRLKVRTKQYCMDAYQLVNGFMFSDDFFCASLRNGTRDACLFDAGAPAVQHNRLMGIMSFGPERCGHEFQPAVFIKAFYFRDFVKSTIVTYKSTADLIAAMESIDATIRPAMHHAEGEHFNPEFNHEDEVTQPDEKHD